MAMTNIMVDLETLDTKASAVILSIGACRFDENEIDNDGFYRVITIQSCIDEGRTISGSTLKWWMDQSERAKAVLNDPAAIPLEDALNDLRAWIGPANLKTAQPWGNSARFDLGILEHAYGRQELPWMFYNEKCFRMLKMTVHYDGGRNEVEREIEGGDFITREAFEQA